METTEQKEVLTLEKVELALKLDMAPEARQACLDDQYKRYKDRKR